MSDAATGSVELVYRISPTVTNDELNQLFGSAWPDYEPSDLGPVLSRSLAFVCAFVGEAGGDERLIGFVNLAWGGGVHAFVLDATVHRDFQQHGIGRQLVECAANVAHEHGVEWLHVDYEPHLHHFYEQCRFEPTMAGLRNLKRSSRTVLGLTALML